jgi:hypothetical protein
MGPTRIQCQQPAPLNSMSPPCIPVGGTAITKTLAYARTTRAVRQTLHATISVVKMLIEEAGAAHGLSPAKWCLQINDQLILKVVVSRSRHDNQGRIRWRILIHTSPIPDYVLCVQMGASNAAVSAYFLIPSLTLPRVTLSCALSAPTTGRNTATQASHQFFGQGTVNGQHCDQSTKS